MKKIGIGLLLMFLYAGFSSCEQAKSILAATGLSNSEVIEGLKTALAVGSDTSVGKLSKLDGYFKDELVKIALPPEALPAYNMVNSIPGGSLLIDDAVLSINRAAEDAAPEAKTIFVNAITSITIDDGFTILNGGDTAATVYLNSKTYNPLSAAFTPKIQNSLSKPLILNTSAEEAYSKLINAYNTASLGGLLFAKITTNTLSQHVTQRALDGLFLKVAEEEKKIRKDPTHQVSDILRRVFGK